MSDPPRSKDEVIREVRYQERLHFRHCRLYRRLRGLLTIVSLASGSAAITSALQAVAGGVAAAGFIVALVTIIDAVGGFAEKAAKHNVWRQSASELRARSGPMDLMSIEAALDRLKANVDDEIENLRAVCWNDVLESVGREDAMRPEKTLQRLMRAMA